MMSLDVFISQIYRFVFLILSHKIIFIMTGYSNNGLRVGNGYDVHALKEGLPMWLCGIKIPSEKGFVAHSDGDVAIHALCDALLGAAALGDIGLHFPDSDPKFKGIDQSQPITLGVRPEHTDVADEGVKATVEVSEMMGSSVHLHLNAEGKDVIVIVPTIDMKGNYNIGDTVHFTFDGKVAHVFSKETDKNLEY